MEQKQLDSGVDYIEFSVHNEEHTVPLAGISPETTLLQYLRDYEHLRGTKYMCLEGGCGICIVAVTATHPLTKRKITFAVNSCLVAIYSCQGWEIHTVDGIGNKKIGYHPIQKQLAAYNGTQCGFCSPGMVMNMYPLYESNATMKEVEDSFGGNMCRCTGYRPILTAFKSLAADADTNILGEFPDIEDSEKCSASRENCQKICQSFCNKKRTLLRDYAAADSKWFKVYSVNEIFDVFYKNPQGSYQFVAGNTARGVYHPKSSPDLYIDVTSVPALLENSVPRDSLKVGANTTLTDTIALFQKVAKENQGFNYLNKLASHIKLVAHVPVRNIGTLAGNLSIKYQHNEFSSDIFLILEAVGAKLIIAKSKRRDVQLDLVDYLSYNMKRNVIKTVVLPKLDTSYNYGSYKIMPRAQNAHALVNAAFLVQLNNKQIVQSARVVYGGIDPSFVHATKTEQYLVGKNLFDNATLQGAFNALNQDVQPNSDPSQPSPIFRKNLALALFYKFVLNIAPENKLSPGNRSGGQLLARPISTGVQDFQTNQSMYPLTQPISKLEALGQTSGEVEYITDIPESFDQLYAYFVTADAPAYTTVTKVDPSRALKMSGVVAFFGKNDIPGQNTFIPMNANYPVGFIPPPLHIVPEELFCSGTVLYYFQPLGVIVAESQELAEKAARMVEVTYGGQTQKPLLSIRQILKDRATDRIFNEAAIERTRKGSDVKHVVKGTYDTTWQYHYHMETQICAVVPEDGNLNIYPGTQWMDIIQTAVASILNISENKINVNVKRLGGGFGAKITRNSLLTCATALAAYKLNKPVKMRMTFSTNMDVIGKRFPSAADYEVGLNDKGEIQYLDNTFYLDYATGGNEPIIALSINSFGSSYKHDTWKVTGNFTKTDNHAGVWVRAPGHTNVIGMIETIMEHIAMQLNKPSLEIRLTNMDPVENKKIRQFMDELRQWADYDNRLKEVEQFNKVNRWMKKGLSLVPMTFPLVYAGSLSATVVIYAGDGTVAVTHGGIEIGQGINTKVAQVCAYALGISLDMVSVKSSNNVASPNNFTTGGSITSEVVCYATLKACETLTKRIQPIKEKMKDATWQQIIKACQMQYVELIASHMYSPNDPPKSYNIYGVCAAEVEVDVLTGMYQILRVDLLEDTGNSMSPCIDVGQVEGAFIMGLGFWTTEKPIYSKEGRLLTNRTWNYKIPGALDIPIDFRVKFPKNNPNPLGVLHSKATGEPPLCLSCAIPIAIRHALVSARLAADSKAPKWYPIDGPSDVENTFLNSLNNYHQYVL